MDENKNNDAEMEAELKTRFGLLPEEIQTAITSSDYQAKLFEISKKYKFTYEQLGILEFNTTLTLLGVLKPADYEKTLAGDLNKEEKEITPLIEDIKKEVFNPIHDSLVKIYTEENEEAQEESTPAIASNEASILAKSGISLEKDGPALTPNAPQSTENRNDMLAELENPVKSQVRVLNEAPKSSIPVTKPMGAVIPVPRAPYADKNMTPAVAKATIPLTAKPPVDIMAGKLAGTFAIPAKETDASIKNIGSTPAPAPVAAPKSGDSYREPVE